MTIHVAERPTNMGVRRSLARWNLELHGGRAPIRYGFSLLCIAVALGVALASHYYGVRDVELPLFELAIVVTTWYAGVGPAVLAVVLSATCYNYFFSEPLYSFEISNEDLPSFFLFTASAAIERVMARDYASRVSTRGAIAHILISVDGRVALASSRVIGAEVS